MGGLGSGRNKNLGAMDTTFNHRKIDVRDWKRRGLLAPNRSFGWQWKYDGETASTIQVRAELGRVVLSYKYQEIDEDWKAESYPIYLDWTSCNYGGKRPWFLCPAMGCGRRVAILYGRGIFACRHCFQIVYPCQREIVPDRARRRADNIREKLGWKPGILNGIGLKPSGMHWRTFEHLKKEHDAFAAITLADLAARNEMIGESLDDWI